jgi:hypothetical protein
MSVQSCSSWHKECGIVAKEILKTARVLSEPKQNITTNMASFLYSNVLLYESCCLCWFYVVCLCFVQKPQLILLPCAWLFHSFLNVTNLFLFFSPGKNLYSLICGDVCWCLSSVLRIVNRVGLPLLTWGLSTIPLQLHCHAFLYYGLAFISNVSPCSSIFSLGLATMSLAFSSTLKIRAVIVRSGSVWLYSWYSHWSG